MNIIIEQDAKTNRFCNTANLDHIKKILKKGPGDTLKVGFLNGDISIVEITDDSFNFKILTSLPSKKQTIRLIVALARPQTIKKIIEHGTTMGVVEFIFFHAHLSEKSYETSKVLDSENYLELMKTGLSQSGIFTILPKLTIIKKIEDIPPIEGKKFILSLNEHNKFPSTLIENEMLTLVIGPERGFIPEEEELFVSKGFKPVKISESILRVEHAVFSSIAQLDFLRMS